MMHGLRSKGSATLRRCALALHLRDPALVPRFTRFLRISALLGLFIRVRPKPFACHASGGKLLNCSEKTNPAKQHQAGEEKNLRETLVQTFVCTSFFRGLRGAGLRLLRPRHRFAHFLRSPLAHPV